MKLVVTGLAFSVPRSIYSSPPTILNHVAEPLKSNWKLFLAAIREHHSAMMFASNSLKNNPQFVLEGLRVDSSAKVLAYIGDELKSNWKFLLSAAKTNIKSITLASEYLQSHCGFRSIARRALARWLNPGNKVRPEFLQSVRCLSQRARFWKIHVKPLRTSEAGLNGR